MPDRPSPISADVLGTVDLSTPEGDEIHTLTRLVDAGLRADQNREGWLEQQRVLTKLRFGIRKPKTFPWQGASNLSIPFIDAAIRKFKPMLMRLVVEPDPVVEFVGEDPEAVANERLAETVYTWLFKTEMNALEPLSYIIDTLCHRGFAFAQVGWDYRTEYECRVVPVAGLFPDGPPASDEEIATRLAEEYNFYLDDPRVARSVAQATEKIRAGHQFVKLAFKRVVIDRPAVWDRDPVQVITPPRTTDPANAEWIIIQHVLSLRKIEQMEADGYFLRGSAQKIREDYKRRTSQPGTGNEIDSAHASGLYMEDALNSERERIWGREDEDNILVWEIMHWHDIDKDGLLDRCVTFVHPKSKTKLRASGYFYPFHEWPIVKFDFEKVNRRWHSPRGISAMLKDLQREINALHNNRLDGMALRNAPCYQIPLLAGFKSRNFRVRPGEVIHVPAGSRLEPLIQDRGAYPEMVNEENLLRSIGETFIGVFDAALTAPQSPTSARTATEIQAVMQYTAATATFDAILFQMAMRELHSKLWQLWLDLGPEEVMVKVLGQDPSTNEPALTPVKKSDIARRFKLIPTGTIANTNRALEMANAREALTVYANDPTGFINKHELYRWHLNLLTYRWARRILMPPQAAQEQQILAQAAASIQQDPALQAQLGMGVPEQPDLPQNDIPEMGQSAVT